MIKEISNAGRNRTRRINAKDKKEFEQEKKEQQTAANSNPASPAAKVYKKETDSQKSYLPNAE